MTHPTDKKIDVTEPVETKRDIVRGVDVLEQKARDEKSEDTMLSNDDRTKYEREEGENRRKAEAHSTAEKEYRRSLP